MNDLFDISQPDDIEEDSDFIGFQPFETDIYIATTKMIYGGKSAKGSRFLTFLGDIDGREYRETFYFTTRDGKTYYERDGKKRNLPGFVQANHILLVTTGKGILDKPKFEERVVKVYDPDQKKEVNTAVPAITAAIGKQVALGIRKKIENRSEKQGDEYVLTAETRIVNEVDKVFHPTQKVTIAEARAKEPATHWDKWLQRNKGVEFDMRKIKNGQSAPGSTTPPSAPSEAAEAPSLFD